MNSTGAVRVRRLCAIAVAMACTLGACSGSGSSEDAAPETTAEAPPSTSSPDSSVPDDAEESDTGVRRTELYERYLDQGLDEDDAGCLADAVVAAAEDPASADPSALFDDCGIDPEQLGDEGSAEDGFRSTFVPQMMDLGYSEEQATCIADGILDLYGLDVSQLDPEVVAGVISDCGGDPSLLDAG